MKPDEPRRPDTVTIYVDGTPHEVPKKDFLTYEEVAVLSDPGYQPGSGITYSITYTRGSNERPEGTLSPGGKVKAKEGISFRVNRTGQS